MKHVWKGCIAGVAGGLAGGMLGALVMSKVHGEVVRLVSAPPPKGEDSTAKVASALARLLLHRDLTPKEKQTMSPIVHYAFGASVGGVYGIVSDVVPIVRMGHGTLFGVAVWLGAHVIAVPALGFSEPISRSSPRQEAAELAGHIVYGSVLDLTRCLLARDTIHA